MTKNAAIFNFFSGFGLTAYPASSVPTSGEEMPTFPYLTYSVSTDQGVQSVSATASVYYRSESWTAINSKVDEISQSIGMGVTLECDEGGIIIRKGTPWAQTLGDDSDNMVKRKILTFEILFATIY